MIRLTFSVPETGSPWRDTWRLPDGSDPASVTETDLRYKHFGAQVEFVIDDMTVISKAGHVTLVDLALSFQSAERRLSSGEDAAFGFTERHEVIRLHGPGSLLSITSSVKPGTAQVSRNELTPELAAFRESVYQALINEVPGLQGNPVVQRLRSAAS
ncbi:hypothetical protein HCA58_21735 [Micromonospora sp. HNM0581]|uniref:hypothetical protein n=1 Tax=Micromonospora sp. HNM0581 TaxID=2716341 RepID=UPI00146A0DE6|nr:hypothetical protein [Micromonospora sp. HNM0581]NLU80930.1 hypothetical protein [Micromonospora sp. HNM0581]